jgi:prepilin-type N-terminal cleavage/methylation domain-containing protein
MNSSNHQLNYLKCKKNQGFTLIELLVTMSITTIISALVLQALVRTQTSFSIDQKRVENGQKMSSVLEILGRDIRQAGELIIEQNFPTIQVKTLNAGGASIIIYRAISEPVTICQDYAAGVAIDGFYFATDKKIPAANNNIGKEFCTVETITGGSPTLVGSNPFPPKQQEGWVDKRAVARNQQSFGMIRNATGTVQSFIYTSEDHPASTYSGASLNLKVGTTGLTPTPEIKVGDTAYLVEKREYLVCGTELKVRVNSIVESTNAVANPACATPNATSDPTATLETVATNIEALNITMITRLDATTANPTPATDAASAVFQVANAAFPITSTGNERAWPNIQSININVRSKDPLERNPALLTAKDIEGFSSKGNFYPRNVLSAK